MAKRLVNMAQKGSFSIGVFGIIFDKDKKALLAKRRDYDLWNLPGGGVDAGETPEEALEREILEEISAKVKNKKLCGVYFKRGKDEVVFAYLVKVKPFTFKPTDEAKEIKYFSVAQLPENLPGSQAKRIKDALNFKGKVIPKVQISGNTQRALKK